MEIEVEGEAMEKQSTPVQEFKVPNFSVISTGKKKEMEVEPVAIVSAGTVSDGGNQTAGAEECAEPLGKNAPSSAVDEKRAAPTETESTKKAAAAFLSKYKEPAGSAPIDPRYGLEVLRNGSIIDKVEFKTDKSFYTVGRLPSCDVSGEHPTISRMHAVLQFIGNSDKFDSVKSEAVRRDDCKEKGLYVFDLQSTHGTFLNKNQLIPGRYYRLHVGHVLKFGNSTRLYVVLGPDEDEEEESDKTVSELMKERNEKELKRKRKHETTGLDVDSDEDDRGVSWGMGDDAIEEAGLSINPFAVDIEEHELSLDNPKRSLQSWFEREGYDLVYDVNEKSSGHFICTINLPLDSANGTPVIAEVDGKGKKKEIMAQCALKACQILDKYGVLRKSNQERLRRKSKGWEERDYYSSDDDTFLDRTGSVEQKRKHRMKQAGKLDEKVETYESLVSQYTDISTQLEELEGKLEEAQLQSKLSGEGGGGSDPLDEFMQDLKSGVTDISRMKSKLKDLTEEKGRLLKLINLTKPVGVIFPVNQNSTSKSALSTKESGAKMATKIMFGPRKGLSGGPKKTLTVPKVVKPEPKTKMSEPVVIDLDDTAEKHIPDSSSETKTVPSVKSDDTKPKRTSNVAEIIAAHSSESDLEEHEEKVAVSTPKRKKQRRLPKKPVSYEYDSMNPDYSVWVPPVGQSGDGKTKLNEKLGY